MNTENRFSSWWGSFVSIYMSTISFKTPDILGVFPFLIDPYIVNKVSGLAFRKRLPFYD